MNIDNAPVRFAALSGDGARLENVMRLLRSRIAPIVGSDGEAKAVVRLIFSRLKGWDTTGLVVHAPDVLSEYVLSRLDAIVAEMEKHRPIQYILGQARFYGMDLEVNPSTLIPRHETEELVDIIVGENGKRVDLRVLDIGTGSGAIAIALSRNLPFSRVTGIDVSVEAVATARRNAEALHASVDFKVADIFTYAPERASLDIVVSNPPYVMEKEKKDMEPEVLDNEPATALLVPDDDPLLYYRRIAEVAMDALVRGGRLYFEINPLCADDLKRMLTDKGYSDIALAKDISGRERFCSARKK